MSIPVIEVGIMTAGSIHFHLNGLFRYDSGEYVSDSVAVDGVATAEGEDMFWLKAGGAEHQADYSAVLEPCDSDCSFELLDVAIGINFHWERKENQSFRGKLKLIARDGMITAVNIINVEDYLLSVISSEMSATSSVEFLKAHAVVSRSWLLAQLEKSRKLKKEGKYETSFINEDGYVRWHDREEHSDFDVCADDHCQRYQGITKILSDNAVEALTDTFGEVLMYDGAVCDARFHKCCGGKTETFENVWEPVCHPYLESIKDSLDGKNIELDTDLTFESNAMFYTLIRPEACCDTLDEKILSQVLNDYDLETKDFFRWTVRLSQDEIKDLLFRRAGIDVGDIINLVAVERGHSGRIVRLCIEGSRGSAVIGKELEIRKALSESHLYSSAFTVCRIFGDEDTVPEDDNAVPSEFYIDGAGWGHGVGLCQVGAAVMSMEGFTYQEILEHYYPKAFLKIIY